mmetsp:Transcript_21942/g.62492  ORF Transcript_21942/g.62492 Transcript_21942/m.62492 type:complete len:459 (-) Transcript_21942:290-1666(-)
MRMADDVTHAVQRDEAKDGDVQSRNEARDQGVVPDVAVEGDHGGRLVEQAGGDERHRSSEDARCHVVSHSDAREGQRRVVHPKLDLPRRHATLHHRQACAKLQLGEEDAPPRLALEHSEHGGARHHDARDSNSHQIHAMGQPVRRLPGDDQKDAVTSHDDEVHEVGIGLRHETPQFAQVHRRPKEEDVERAGDGGQHPDHSCELASAEGRIQQIQECRSLLLLRLADHVFGVTLLLALLLPVLRFFRVVDDLVEDGCKEEGEPEWQTPGPVIHLLHREEDADAAGDSRCHQESADRTGVADGTAEAPGFGTRLLDGKDVRSCQLAADAQPLQHAQQHQEDRGKRSPGRVSWQQSHQHGRHGDQHDRKHESVLSPDETIPDLSEHDGSQRPHEERRKVHSERIDQLQFAVGLREEACSDFRRQESVHCKIVPFVNVSANPTQQSPDVVVAVVVLAVGIK